MPEPVSPFSDADAIARAHGWDEAQRNALLFAMMDYDLSETQDEDTTAAEALPPEAAEAETGTLDILQQLWNETF